MEIIERAFYRSYSKRSQNILMLLISIIIVTAAQIAMFIESNLFPILFAVICTFALFVGCRILLSRKSYVRQKISHALHNATQSDLFFSSIEAEMRSLNLQTYSEDRNRIYVFVTLNWLILVSPNGCLISMLQDIKDISVDFQESRSKFRLKVDYFNGSSSFCAYERLYEPIVELINKSKGVVS